MESNPTPTPSRGIKLKGRPIVGFLPERQSAPLKFFTDMPAKYGSLVQVRMGPLPVWLVNDPDLIHDVLLDPQKAFIKGFGYDQLSFLLGNGLLTSEGDLWKRQRKLAQPAFHMKQLARIVDQMTGVMNEWRATEGKALLKQGTVDFAQAMYRLTLKIVTVAILGSDLSKSEMDEVSRAVEFLLEHANHRMLSLVRSPRWLPTPRNVRAKKEIQALDRIVFRMIDERRKNPDPTKADLMGMLLDAVGDDESERMNDQQLRDEIMTMFLAGHETTANLLSWTFMLLDQHPDALARVITEVETVLPNGKTPDFTSLRQLTYTTAVLEESLRLYPPAWIVSRQATRDVDLQGWKITKGEVVTISAYSLQRNPEFWSEPEAFKPERFAPDAPDPRKNTYLPFGGGARVCIGQQFAILEALIVTAALVRDAVWTRGNRPAVIAEPLITLRPKGGMEFDVRPWPAQRLGASPTTQESPRDALSP